MEPTHTPFTAIYSSWLDQFRTMLTGRPSPAPAKELTPKAAQVEADQEWEHEGGAIKPAKTPDPQAAPKLPL